MDKGKEYVANTLFAIRKKYLSYFLDNDCKILSCVSINWAKPISAHVTNKLLPFDIACDLEEMFWIMPSSIEVLNNIMAEIKLEVSKSQILRRDFYSLYDGLKAAAEKQKAVLELLVRS